MAGVRVRVLQAEVRVRPRAPDVLIRRPRAKLVDLDDTVLKLVVDVDDNGAAVKEQLEGVAPEGDILTPVSRTSPIHKKKTPHRVEHVMNAKDYKRLNTTQAP